MRKIAVMLNTLDPFFFPAGTADDCIFPVQAGSALAALGERQLGNDSILTYHANEPVPELDTALQKTDLGTRMKSAGITHLVMPHRASEAVHAWADQNDILIVAPPFDLQRDLEHKIRFDNALQKYGIPAPRTISQADIRTEKGPIVAQESASFGLYGTRFFVNGSSFLDDPMYKTPDLLIRVYEDGLPVGISLLIDKDGNYCISALRRQCFIYENGFPAIFTGVQWMPYSYFDAATLHAVEQVMESLRTMLLDMRFRGLANFDLLLSGSDCKVLECNPRLSSATAHIFGGHGLTPLDDPWAFFVNACIGSPNDSIHDKHIPRVEYEGALLDVDVQGTVSLKALPEVGQHDGMYIFHELFPGTDTVSDDTVCTVISDKALFDLSSGNMNKEGRRIYDSIRRRYITNNTSL